MNSEKEQLTDFSLCIMKELGIFQTIPERSKWLKAPLSGIRQAANDMVGLAMELNSAELSELEEKLQKLGLPSIESVRSGNSKIAQKALTKQKIENEDEWRIIKSEVEIGFGKPREIENLEKLLHDFETKDS